MEENILNPLHTKLRPNAVNQPRVIQTPSLPLITDVYVPVVI